MQQPGYTTGSRTNQILTWKKLKTKFDNQAFYQRSSAMFAHGWGAILDGTPGLHPTIRPSYAGVEEESGSLAIDANGSTVD